MFKLGKPLDGLLLFSLSQFLFHVYMVQWHTRVTRFLGTVPFCARLHLLRIGSLASGESWGQWRWTFSCVLCYCLQSSETATILMNCPPKPPGKERMITFSLTFELKKLSFKQKCLQQGHVQLSLHTLRFPWKVLGNLSSDMETPSLPSPGLTFLCVIIFPYTLCAIWVACELKLSHWGTFYILKVIYGL